MAYMYNQTLFVCCCFFLFYAATTDTYVSPRPYQLLCRYPSNHCESRSYTSTNRTKHVSDRKEGRKEEKKDKHIGSFQVDLRVSISDGASMQSDQRFCYSLTSTYATICFENE